MGIHCELRDYVDVPCPMQHGQLAGSRKGDCLLRATPQTALAAFLLFFVRNWYRNGIIIW